MQERLHELAQLILLVQTAPTDKSQDVIKVE